MELVKLEAFKVVGLKITCKEDMLTTEMPKLWAAFMSRLSEIVHRTDDSVMDISLEVTGKDYTECICAPVSEFAQIPAGMVALEIPTATYVHHKHEGPVTEIWRSFWNMQNWSRTNGYTVDPNDFRIDSNREGHIETHKLYIRVIT